MTRLFYLASFCWGMLLCYKLHEWHHTGYAVPVACGLLLQLVAFGAWLQKETK